jgi:hypothetical protein
LSLCESHQAVQRFFVERSPGGSRCQRGSQQLGAATAIVVLEQFLDVRHHRRAALLGGKRAERAALDGYARNVRDHGAASDQREYQRGQRCGAAGDTDGECSWT